MSCSLLEFSVYAQELDQWIETNESFAHECKGCGHHEMAKKKTLLAMVERQLKRRIVKLVLEPARDLLLEPTWGWHNVLVMVKAREGGSSELFLPWSELIIAAEREVGIDLGEAKTQDHQSTGESQQAGKRPLAEDSTAKDQDGKKPRHQQQQQQQQLPLPPSKKKKTRISTLTQKPAHNGGHDDDDDDDNDDVGDNNEKEHDENDKNNSEKEEEREEVEKDEDPSHRSNGGSGAQLLDSHHHHQHHQQQQQQQQQKQHPPSRQDSILTPSHQPSAEPFDTPTLFSSPRGRGREGRQEISFGSGSSEEFEPPLFSNSSTPEKQFQHQQKETFTASPTYSDLSAGCSANFTPSTIITSTAPESSKPAVTAAPTPSPAPAPAGVSLLPSPFSPFRPFQAGVDPDDSSFAS
jgi:hypothetical protein